MSITGKSRSISSPGCSQAGQYAFSIYNNHLSIFMRESPSSISITYACNSRKSWTADPRALDTDTQLGHHPWRCSSSIYRSRYSHPLPREVADSPAGTTTPMMRPPLQSCQVWPFRGQKANLALFKIGWPRNFFYNLLSSWPYFRSIKVSIVKSKMLPFLKQRLAFVSYKHMATLGGQYSGRPGWPKWQCRFFCPPVSAAQKGSTACPSFNRPKMTWWSKVFLLFHSFLRGSFLPSN